MEGKHVGIIVVVLLVIAGAWYMLSGTPAVAPTTTKTPAATTPPVTVTTGPTIVYTDQGFQPSPITIPAGTKVSFVNQSTGDMWVASAVHPTHSVYSGTTLGQHCTDAANTSFDECVAIKSGGTYEFTFDKVGTWKYHNHMSASKVGSIVVTAKP